MKIIVDNQENSHTFIHIKVGEIYLILCMTTMTKTTENYFFSSFFTENEKIQKNFIPIVREKKKFVWLAMNVDWLNLYR